MSKDKEKTKLYLFFLCVPDDAQKDFYLFTDEEAKKLAYAVGLESPDGTTYPLYGWTIKKSIANTFKEMRGANLFICKSKYIDDRVVDDLFESEFSNFEIDYEKLLTKDTKEKKGVIHVNMLMTYWEYLKTCDFNAPTLCLALHQEGTLKMNGYGSAFSFITSLYDFPDGTIREDFKDILSTLRMDEFFGLEYPIEMLIDIDELAVFIHFFGNTLREM